MLLQNIKKICKQKKIPISQMEHDLGLARSSVCKWNKNEPGITKVQKVANYLNVTVNELLSEVQEGE